MKLKVYLLLEWYYRSFIERIAAKILVNTGSSTQEKNASDAENNEDSKIDVRNSPKEGSRRSSYSNISTTISNGNNEDKDSSIGIKKEIEVEIKDETKEKQSYIEIENKEKKVGELENKNSQKESDGSSSVTDTFNINNTKIVEINDETTKDIKKNETTNDIKKNGSNIPNPNINIKEGNILDNSFSDKSNLNFNNDYDKKIIESLLSLINNKDCKINSLS